MEGAMHGPSWLRLIFVLAGTTWLLSSIQQAQAQTCLSSNDCARDKFCVIPVCITARCNADVNCPGVRPSCFAGICQKGCRNNAECGAGMICAGRTATLVGLCQISRGSGGGGSGGGGAG